MKILLILAGIALIIFSGVYYYIFDSKDISIEKQTYEKPSLVIDDEHKLANQEFVISAETDKNENKIQLSTSKKNIINLKKQQNKLNDNVTKKAKEKMLASSKKEQVSINSKVKNLEQDLHNKAARSELVDELKNASSYRKAILDKAKQEIN